MADPSAPTALVFTVGLNGYAEAYADCLRSQRAYADRIGATYVAVRRPFRVRQPALAAWLKVPLLLEALRSGYEWVAFIDADARVQERAPDLRVLDEPAGAVHMALGRSGRLNSGVILAQSGPASFDYLDQLMASVTGAVPAEDRADLKFENGNAIYVARTSGLVAEAPLEWNNTYRPELDDFVRHYTGPLRSEHTRSVMADRVFELRKKLVDRPRRQPERRDAAFVAALTELTSSCQGRYPGLLRQTP